MGILSMVGKVKESGTRRLETGIMHETNFNRKILGSFLYTIFVYSLKISYIYTMYLNQIHPYPLQLSPEPSSPPTHYILLYLFIYWLQLMRTHAYGDRGHPLGWATYLWPYFQRKVSFPAPTVINCSTARGEALKAPPLPTLYFGHLYFAH